MFSEDELLNNGSSYAVYYGYDIYGNKADGDASLANFFEEEGSKRLIAPFNPIYTAGYIQDKFAIEDFIFNVFHTFLVVRLRGDAQSLFQPFGRSDKFDIAIQAYIFSGFSINSRITGNYVLLASSFMESHFDILHCS